MICCPTLVITGALDLDVEDAVAEIVAAEDVAVAVVDAATGAWVADTIRGAVFPARSAKFTAFLIDFFRTVVVRIFCF